VLIVLGGLPGSGKTTVARELARELGAVHLRIDSVEHAIAAAGHPVGQTGYVAAYAVAGDQLHLQRVTSCRSPVTTHRAERARSREAAAHICRVERAGTLSSAGFEVSADGVADDVADLAVALVGDPSDGLVRIVVDAQVQSVGVAGSPGQGRPAGRAPGQGARVEPCLCLGGQSLLVVGVECGTCPHSGPLRLTPDGWAATTQSPPSTLGSGS